MCILDLVPYFILSEIKASGHGFILNVVMVFVLGNRLTYVCVCNKGFFFFCCLKSSGLLPFSPKSLKMGQTSDPETLAIHEKTQKILSNIMTMAEAFNYTRLFFYKSFPS
jgi:hypothetical protein